MSGVNAHAIFEQTAMCMQSKKRGIHYKKERHGATPIPYKMIGHLKALKRAWAWNVKLNNAYDSYLGHHQVLLIIEYQSQVLPTQKCNEWL